MSPYYPTVMQAHKGFAYLSITLFLVRGGLMLADKNALLATKPLKILPHVIDTGLLLCAFTLLLLGGMGMPNTWLLAKFFGMVLYVGLGFVALKLGKTKAVRASAFVAALVVVLYVVKIAKSKVVF